MEDATSTSRAAWAAGSDAAAAIDEELSQLRSRPSTRDMGRAVADADASDATGTVFRVDVRGVQVSESSLKELFLARSARTERVPVDEVVCWVGDEIVVRAAVEPVDGLHLFALTDPLFVLQSLARCLRETTTPRLGEALARRKLEAGTPHAVASLNAVQQAAAGETIAPGLNVIWGPPGTGKTQVIVEAIRHLIDAGRSVLLVSSTNIAVDQALERAWRMAGEPGPGVMVRIGYPMLPAVGEHPWLVLERACERLGGERTRRLEGLAAEIAALADNDRIRQLAEAERALAGFTPEALEQAIQRLANGERRAAAERRRDHARRALDEATTRQRSAADALAGAHAAATSQASWIQAWANVEALDAVADARRRELDAASAAVTGLQAGLDGLDAALLVAAGLPWRERRRERRPLKARRRELRRQLAHARDAVAQHDLLHATSSGAADTARTHLVSQPGHLRHQQVVDIRATLVAATEERSSAEAALADARHAARTAEEEYRRVGKLPIARDGDFQLVERAREQNLLGRYAELEALRAAVAPLAEKLAALRLEHRRLRAELAGLADRVIGDAKVIATTLAKLAVDRRLAARAVDHVIVDEVSAALIPHVLHAATLAERGVTLLGDFWQNGPISAVATAAGDDVDGASAPARRWLCQDVFEFLDLHEPDRIASTAGATVLRDQYRFGAATTAFANRVAYGGLLRKAGSASPPDDGLGEIVFVDTQRLGALASVEVDRTGRGGRWWAGGALLTRALAEHHAAGGRSVGAVTPYALQAQLTDDLVSSSAHAPAIEVGTAHRFQGREFPIVVFDLVEDGDGRSWVARANAAGRRWHRGGVRVANVAVTRNAGRVYVIGNGRAVVAARHGPLAELQALIADGMATVLDAAAFLPEHLRPSPHTRPSPPAALHLPRELEALAFPAGDGSHAPLRLFDAASFYPELSARLAEAKRCVAMWAPFLARSRLYSMLPALAETTSRRVRVVVFTKPTQERKENAEELMAALEDSGVKVVPIWGVHEKIVVIDERQTFVGSLNVLSANPATGELMVAVDGQPFAKRLMDHQRAHAFGNGGGRCTTHRERRYARRVGQEWRWWCPSCTGPGQHVAFTGS